MTLKTPVPPDKYITAIKNTMKNMFKTDIDVDFVNKINDAISRVSIIVFHTYNFLNLYFMHLYDANKQFPSIDEHFVSIIMLVVSKRVDNRSGRTKEETQKIIDRLKKFYEKNYLPLIKNEDIPINDKLSQILLYEATDIVKNINNNIAQHYVQHVHKLVNVKYDVERQIQKIKLNKDLSFKQKKIEMKKIHTVYNKIKADLLNHEPFEQMELTSDPKFHVWIANNKHFITPLKIRYLKNSIHYDVKAKPQDYLKCLFFINKKIASKNDKIIEFNQLHPKKPKQLYKLFHVLPLRTSIVPKHITIDTCALTALIVTKNKLDYLKNITNKAAELWSMIFNLNTSFFKKKGFTFHHMIKTDGVSCSTLFIKLDKNGNPYKLKSITRIEKKRVAENNDNILYIENVEITAEMKDKLLVAIDPNHGNLMSCMAETRESPHNIIVEDANNQILEFKHKDTIKFRYTRPQRNVETRAKKYNTLRESLKEDDKIDNKSITEIESNLSVHDSKTCDTTKFCSYLKEKVTINRKLKPHYEQPIYRKLKMNIYINTQKSESKMLRNFKKKFGSPNNVIIVFGDYDRIDTMKGCEPHISKRLRKLLQQEGYEIYKINECNTSKLCNKCECENERFMYVEGHLLWGLLRCTNEECKTIHNRDHNSTRNMIKIAKNIFNGKGRPQKYVRQKTS
jgi:hypothetical protein